MKTQQEQRHDLGTYTFPNWPAHFISSQKCHLSCMAFSHCPVIISVSIRDDIISVELGLYSCEWDSDIICLLSLAHLLFVVLLILHITNSVNWLQNKSLVTVNMIHGTKYVHLIICIERAKTDTKKVMELIDRMMTIGNYVDNGRCGIKAASHPDIHTIVMDLDADIDVFL